MDDRDLLVRAREAFAAYKGLGRAIVDEMIAELEHLRGAHGRGVARLEQENKAFRQANASLDKELWRLRELLSEIDAELDRQLWSDPHVKSCRENDLNIVPECEHHVIITQALREKISDVAETTK